jgi:YD repeat-containing protein
MSYAYDPAGNLTEKKSVSGSDGTPTLLTTSYTYDALGRNTLTAYDSYPNGSFYLERYYDGATNVKTQTYPSGRTVNYNYDTAGRINSFTGNLGGITGVNYATDIRYNSYGLTARETYGTQTALYLNLHYNNRLQMVDLRLGNSSTDEWNWGRGALIYYYGTDARTLWNPFANSLDNNGNLLRQVNYVPLSGGGSVVPQLDDYNYDALNRTTSVSEQQQSQSGQWTSVFTQAFSYDRWGNRTINVGATTPSVAGVTRKTFVVDTTTNRLTSVDGVGMTYDAAGNQTYDGVGTHYYDTENRMTKALQGSSNNYYFYDANGKRVRRILNGSQTWGGQETWFVYGFEEEMVAEYAYNQVSAPLPGSPQKEYGYRGGKMLVVWDGTQAGDEALKWLVADHLGSTRMEANKSGSLAGMRRHDYLPFGEELVASSGAQRSGVGYEPPASNVKQKFGL